MKIVYLISGLVFLLTAFVLFTNSLKLGEKKSIDGRKGENRLFARSLISMVVGLLFIFLYVIEKSFKK